MKVWISKYALSAGIEELEVDVGANENDALCFRTNTGWLAYHHKGDWHQTREQAVAKAEDMRQRKLKSLEKQIKKLKELKFD